MMWTVGTRKQRNNYENAVFARLQKTQLIPVDGKHNLYVEGSIYVYIYFI